MIPSLRLFFRGKERIFCYGIGSWAKRISNYCLKHHLHIDGYLVSRASGTYPMYHGRPVYVVSPSLLHERDGIILATSGISNIHEMLCNLKDIVSKEHIYLPFDHEDFSTEFYALREKSRRKQSRQRKSCHLFHYFAIGASMTLFEVFLDPEKNRIDYSNRCYGQDALTPIRASVKGYHRMQCTILHSVYFFPRFTERELHPPDGNLFCMTKNIFHGVPLAGIKRIHAIGPYIQYVKPLLSYRKIQRLKTRLGRTLLVVPSHVPQNRGMAFSYADWIEEIERIKRQYHFQTVLVSIGPTGFQTKYLSLYHRQGYKIVTSGDSMDLHYLRRLRTFIALSDTTMGNDCVTTFIGYSIVLGRPFYYYPMKINYAEASDRNDAAGYKDFSRTDDGMALLRRKAEQCFGTFHEQITEQQYAFVEHYWGKWNRRRQCRDMIRRSDV